MRSFPRSSILSSLLVAAALTTAAPVAAQSTGPISHADIQRWAYAWNSHDIDTVMTLFTPDVVIHQPSNPKPLDATGTRAFFR